MTCCFRRCERWPAAQTASPRASARTTSTSSSPTERYLPGRAFDLEKVVLIAPRAAPPPGDPGRLRERSLDVGKDRALRARGDERLAQAVDVHVCAPAVAALPGLDRDECVDAVGAH